MGINTVITFLSPIIFPLTRKSNLLAFANVVHNDELPNELASS
jgi:hypothetical protein